MHSGTLTINAPKVVHETIDGETIIIHLGTGTYYSLDGVGADIWALLDHEVSGVELAAAAVARYDAEPALVEHSVLTLIDKLLGEDLVVEGFATADRRPTAAPELRPVLAPFVPPVLRKYTDMQEFMLVDPLHDVDEQAGWPHAKTA